MSKPECPFLIPASQVANSQKEFSHPWNPDSQIRGTHLSHLTGMKDAGISWVEIPPGKESFVYHLHHREDEWIYVLSGQGTAEINEQEYPVGPGDFMGFPAGQAAHHLRNSGSEVLRYLMGGSNRQFELADFPRLGRRMIRREDQIEILRTDDLEGFGPLDDDN